MNTCINVDLVFVLVKVVVISCQPNIPKEMRDKVILGDESVRDLLAIDVQHLSQLLLVTTLLPNMGLPLLILSQN